jgi:hypothetical protein
MRWLENMELVHLPAQGVLVLALGQHLEIFIVLDSKHQ